MRVECHDMGEDAAEREGLGRFAQSVDERIIPGGAVSDLAENTMQFSIGLFEPLQQRLRGALRFGRAVHIHIGSGQRGGPDFLGEDNGWYFLMWARESFSNCLRRMGGLGIKRSGPE